jgi:hypothetical protein
MANLAEVDCYAPNCRRTFFAVRYETAYAAMKEHFEQDHPEMQPTSTIHWTFSDLKFLEGCLISPD